MKTIYSCSPALWFIFAAPFWVILLRKVPVNNELTLKNNGIDSDYNKNYLLGHILELNKDSVHCDH